MVISITSSQLTPEQIQPVETFLQSFLPRLKTFPGVTHIYHYGDPAKGKDVTLIIWETQEALAQYRSSDLIQEAVAFEKKMGLASQRENYPLLFMA